MSVLRSMTWSAMDEAARRALCARGLEAIFDDDLKASIGRIIDDVRTHGDEAVCRALKEFDHVSLEPHQLRVTADEIA
ncbi:MAG: histidinol dehydrogenase, partial [Ilumatobacteraceae bacterium]